MKSNLNVAIKEVYLNQILKGAKTTEYRDMSDYWIEKLVDKAFYPGMDNSEIRESLTSGQRPLKWNKYKTITFHCGPKTAVYRIEDIKVYDHHTTFAIKLGTKIS